MLKLIHVLLCMYGYLSEADLHLTLLIKYLAMVDGSLSEIQSLTNP